MANGQYKAKSSFDKRNPKGIALKQSKNQHKKE